MAPQITNPTPGVAIVALAGPDPVRVKGDDWHGTAIACSFNGNSMQYLVIVSGADGPPAWIDESQIAGTGYGRANR